MKLINSFTDNNTGEAVYMYDAHETGWWLEPNLI